ncbi:MAG: hypothetical protein ACKOTZ_05000 [Chloroflexota bacterium]
MLQVVSFIRRRHATARRAAVVPLAAGALVLALASAAAADSADPVTVDVVQDGLTVTFSGTWGWTSKFAPCGPGTTTNRSVGWQADWDDGFTGNPVPSKRGPAGLLYHMGSATDNAIYRSSANGGLGDCGIAAPNGAGVVGTWGPISHTYAEPGEYHVCVLMYDVRYTQTTTGRTVVRDARQLVAGGANRNRDNSAETNNYAAGNQCAAEVVVVVDGELTLTKTVAEPTYAAVGDLLHYDFRVENSGTTAIAGPVVVDGDRTTDESCPDLATVGNTDGFLDPGEHVICTAAYSVVQGDLDAGEVVNSATASADGVTSNESTATAEADRDTALGPVRGAPARL